MNILANSEGPDEMSVILPNNAAFLHLHVNQKSDYDDDMIFHQSTLFSRTNTIFKERNTIYLESITFDSSIYKGPSPVYCIKPEGKIH